MKQNLLWVGKGAPNKIKSAGDIRSLKILDILKEKYNITCWFSSADFGINDIKCLGIEPVQNGAEWVFDEICKKSKPDIIILSHWSIAHRYIDYIRQRTNVPIIIDTIDVEFLRLQRENEYKQHEIYDIRKVREAELDIYRKADKLICVTEIDKQELLKHCDFNIDIIPCLFEEKVNELVKTKNAYTICNWSHAPNIANTEWLCREIMPYVDLKLYIVGKHPPSSLTRYSSDKIEFCQAVFNIDQFVSDKSICLAPILYGAGMNGKVAEALNYGIPVITTTFGAIPFELEHRQNVMIANGPIDYISCINEVKNDLTLQNRLSANGKELMKKYTTDYWNKKVKETI